MKIRWDSYVVSLTGIERSLTHRFSAQNVVHCIKTIHILTAVDPSLLSTAKATMLLPFLKSATSVRFPSPHRIYDEIAEYKCNSPRNKSFVTICLRSSALQSWVCLKLHQNSRKTFKLLYCL